MAGQSLLRWRVYSYLGIDGGIVAGDTTVLFDQTAGCVGVFLTDKDDGATDTGKNFLLSVKGRDIAIDVRGVEEAADHHGFRFLFGIEYSDQLLVRVRTLFQFFRHS